MTGVHLLGSVVTQRRHAFRSDDALGCHDAVDLAAMMARREVSAHELTAAALARAAAVADLGGVASTGPTVPGDPDGPLGGVPIYVKDNVDVRWMPTGQGSDAFTALPAVRHSPVAAQLLEVGLTVLGKSRMPEFGLNASTEFGRGAPARNPWRRDHTPGASSGGAAVLVAAGVVPLAHANDGGGSIRIPAACCGLVGLKPGLGRLGTGRVGRLPIELVSDGVLTRSVRDSAAFLAAAEGVWRNPALPPVGLVEGPPTRRLHIGLVLDSPVGPATCGETVDAVLRTAATLEAMGHTVEPVTLPFGPSFAQDILDYWGMLAFLALATGRWLQDRGFDAARTEGLTRGLRERYVRSAPRTPSVLRRLRRAGRTYAALLRRHDLLLSPVLGHATPPLGQLSPDVPIAELLSRLVAFAAFTPLANVAGTPAIAVPVDLTTDGLPVGVQFAAAHGGERTLLEVAFALEQDRTFPRIHPLGP